MRQIIAVYKRELGLYFRSPVAYAIAFALMLFFGLLFSNSLNSANGQAPADGVNFVPNLLTFLLFLVGPLLTMRLLAEETREGTLEVLMTLPMSESQFIIGKFLAVWTYYTVVLLLTVIASIKSFDLIFTMTRGGPSNATLVPNIYMYQLGFQLNRFGYAAAVALIGAVLVFAVNFVIHQTMRRIDKVSGQ